MVWTQIGAFNDMFSLDSADEITDETGYANMLWMLRLIIILKYFFLIYFF